MSELIRAQLDARAKAARSRWYLAETANNLDVIVGGSAATSFQINQDTIFLVMSIAVRAVTKAGPVIQTWTVEPPQNFLSTVLITDANNTFVYSSEPIDGLGLNSEQNCSWELDQYIVCKGPQTYLVNFTKYAEPRLAVAIQQYCIEFGGIEYQF